MGTGINKILFANPFFLFGTSFLIVLTLYALNWSDLYPRIGLSVGLFLIIFFIYNTILGFIFMKRCRPTIWANRTGINLLMFVWFYLSWTIVFAYNGGIPLWQLLNNTFDNELHLLPTIYVVIYSFSSFFSILLYQHFRATKKKVFLIHFLISILPPLLMVSRIGVITTLLSVLFVHLYTLPRIRKRVVILMVPILLVVLYFFGVLGNLRSQVFEGDSLARQTAAKDSFMESLIPQEFYWTYIYGASPLANFQNIVNKTDVGLEELDVDNFLIYYGLPDFITTRIEQKIDIHKPYPENKFIVDFLNVCTMFTNAYLNLGWLGPYLVLVWYSLFMMAYVFMLNRNTPYFLTGLASISTIFFFGIFDNILVFSAVSLQLVYPLIFGLRISIKSRTLSTKSILE